MLLPDGRALGDPSNAEIAEAAGAPVEVEEHAFDVVIVGAGPTGLSAAVRLGIPSLEALNGAGVFYGGPTWEAHALTGKDAYIVGGGNSAGQAALHLARFARRATLVVRGQSLDVGMSHYLVREVEATPNVEVRTETEVGGGGGEGRLQQLVLRQSPAGNH